MRRTIENWNMEIMFQELFWERPEMKDEPWVNEMYSLFAISEDPNERAPALSELFVDPERKARPEGLYTVLNPMELVNFRLNFKVHKEGDEDGR